MSERPATTADSSILPVILSFAALALVAVTMFVRPRTVIEVSIWDFLIITVVIGGWAAYMTGRAIASTWRPYWHVPAYMVPFAIFVRWVHFALFHGTLLSIHYTIVDFVVVLALATIGYRLVRTKQMTTQYRWIYERTSAFTWRRRAVASG